MVRGGNPGHGELEADPLLFPLAPGEKHRTKILRGAGNAIQLQTATYFIQAAQEAIEDLKGADDQ